MVQTPGVTSLPGATTAPGVTSLPGATTAPGTTFPPGGTTLPGATTAPGATSPLESTSSPETASTPSSASQQRITYQSHLLAPFPNHANTCHFNTLQTKLGKILWKLLPGDTDMYTLRTQIKSAHAHNKLQYDNL